MTNVLDQFVEKKKANSEFIALNDGESAVIAALKDMKIVTKTGFDGGEKEVLRLVCEVETSEGIRLKKFDNGTERFASSLVEHKIKIGDSFKITRHGLQSKTRYEISDVKHAAPATA